MNTQQVKWAMAHDWYLSCHQSICGGLWSVKVSDDDAPSKFRIFSDFTALMHWAGY